MTANKKLNGLYSPTDSIKGFIPQIVEDFICEFCGEECDGNLKFKVSVVYTEGSKDKDVICCPGCVSTFFTETPEDIKKVEVEAI